jgi:hypothetical protein
MLPTDEIEFLESKSFMVHKYKKSSLSFEGIITFPKNQVTRKPYFITKLDLNTIKKKQFEIIVIFIRNGDIELESELLEKMKMVIQNRYPNVNWEFDEK